MIIKDLRRLEEIKEIAKSLGWRHYQAEYQDHFRKDNVDFCLKAFGRFKIYDIADNWNIIGSEASTSFEDVAWYKEILQIVYEPVDESGNCA